MARGLQPLCSSHVAALKYPPVSSISPAGASFAGIFGLSCGVIFAMVKKDTGYTPHTVISYESKIPIPPNGTFCHFGNRRRAREL